jgi:hypothetical protein
VAHNSTPGPDGAYFDQPPIQHENTAHPDAHKVAPGVAEAGDGPNAEESSYGEKEEEKEVEYDMTQSADNDGEDDDDDDEVLYSATGPDLRFTQTQLDPDVPATGMEVGEHEEEESVEGGGDGGGTAGGYTGMDVDGGSSVS